MKLDNTLFWHDAGGCHWCGRKTDNRTEGHDGMCPVPLLVIFEAENERYQDALQSIAGTNTKPSHLKKNWMEMMLAAKYRAKKALGGES